MRSLADLPALLFTTLGRRALAGAVVRASAPLLLAGAGLRRRSMGRSALVAVVGSFGKTTTSRAVRAALGLPPGAQRASSIPFAALLLLRRGSRRRPMVLEVGIRQPGQMGPAAAALRPDIVVVTSIGSEHLRSFHTLEALRNEKVHMVRGLRRTGTAILNGDDPHVLWMRDMAPGRVVTFGYGEECDVRATPPRIEGHGMRFDVELNGRSRPAALRLIGERSVPAALAALAVSAELGLEATIALERLAELRPATGRLQPMSTPSGCVVLRDDHKSSYETILAALDALEALPARRRIAVLGDITEPPAPQRQSYRRIGERAAAVADRLVTVGYQHHAYRSGAVGAGLRSEEVLDGGRSVESARRCLPVDLGPGDVVLVKGRQRQRLGRLALELAGRTVGCRLQDCAAILTDCESCPRLEAGWEGRRVVF